jgi:hypothetical protein
VRVKLQARRCLEESAPNSIVAYVVLDQKQQGNLWQQDMM